MQPRAAKDARAIEQRMELFALPRDEHGLVRLSDRVKLISGLAAAAQKNPDGYAF